MLSPALLQPPGARGALTSAFSAPLLAALLPASGWDGAAALALDAVGAAPAPLGADGAAAAAAAAAVPSLTVNAGEPLQLLAEPWVLSYGAADDTALAWGASAAAAAAAPLPHLWHGGKGVFSSPAFSSFAVFRSGAVLAAAAGAAPAAGPAAVPAAVGFALPPGAQCSWSFVGAPSAFVSGAAPAAFPFAAAHAFTLSAPALNLTVPPGTLRPGYLYRATPAASFAARWLFPADVAALPPPWAPAAAAAPAPATPAAAAAAAFAYTFAAADAAPAIASNATATPAPLLWAHLPPLGGALAPAPAAGTASSTAFALSAAGWGTEDDGVTANAPISSAGSAAGAALAGSGAALAAWAAALPLEPAAQAAA